MSIAITRRLPTVADYHRMREVGIVEERGAELINGAITESSSVGSLHVNIVGKLMDMFTVGLSNRAMVRVQNPIAPFLIEVAISSAAYDREVKLPLYAQQGIPVCWLVDIAQQCIEIHTQPKGSTYTQRRICQVPESVWLEAYGLRIDLVRLFSVTKSSDTAPSEA